MVQKFFLSIACLSLAVSNVFGFVPVQPSVPGVSPARLHHLEAKKKGGSGSSDRITGGGKGFSISEVKTYDTNVIKDLIDVEGAMNEFFAANEAWSPLFRSVAASASVPAMSFLGGTHGEEIEFHESSKPWTRFEGIPTHEDDRQILASFLDSMQQSLLDIPVDETTGEDELDLHFLEEGRRMLVLSRFHVLRETTAGSVDGFDSLFSRCWSELAELSRANEPDTGSLILVPDYDLDDLRRFTDMNLVRPLQWLGMDSVFEVSSLQRESPGIRLIHKLSDMPTEPYDPEAEAS